MIWCYLLCQGTSGLSDAKWAAQRLPAVSPARAAGVRFGALPNPEELGLTDEDVRKSAKVRARLRFFSAWLAVIGDPSPGGCRTEIRCTELAQTIPDSSRRTHSGSSPPPSPTARRSGSEPTPAVAATTVAQCSRRSRSRWAIAGGAAWGVPEPSVPPPSLGPTAALWAAAAEAVARHGAPAAPAKEGEGAEVPAPLHHRHAAPGGGPHRHGPVAGGHAGRCFLWGEQLRCI